MKVIGYKINIGGAAEGIQSADNLKKAIQALGASIKTLDLTQLTTFYNLLQKIETTAKSLPAIKPPISVPGTSGKPTDTTLPNTDNLKRLRNEITLLRKEYDIAIQNTAEQSAAFDKLVAKSAELRNKTQQLSRATREQSVQQQLAADNTKQSIGYYDKLQLELTDLTNQFRRLSEAEAKGDFGKTLSLRANNINNELKQLDEQFGRYQRKVGNYKDAVKGFLSDISGGLVFGGAVAAASVAADALRNVANQVIDINVAVSEKSAALAKALNVPIEAVQGIVDKIKEIDSTKSLTDLLGIAIQGGKNGVTINDITGFTEAVDTLTTALRDDFGDNVGQIAEKVLALRTSLGGVFKTDNIESDILRLGNALNGLADSGNASADEILNITNRAGALTQAFQIAEPQLLATSTILAEQKINAEIAGTAIGNLYKQISRSPEEFTKKLKIGANELKQFTKDTGNSAKSFADIVDKDIGYAFNIVIKRISELNLSNTEATNIFDDLIGKEAGVGAALAALTTRYDDYNKVLGLANQLSGKTNGLLQEQKNFTESLAGTIASLKSEWGELLQSKKTEEFFKLITNSLRGWIFAFNELAKAISTVASLVTKGFGKTLSEAKERGLSDYLDTKADGSKRGDAQQVEILNRVIVDTQKRISKLKADDAVKHTIEINRLNNELLLYKKILAEKKKIYFENARAKDDEDRKAAPDVPTTPNTPNDTIPTTPRVKEIKAEADSVTYFTEKISKLRAELERTSPNSDKYKDIVKSINEFEQALQRAKLAESDVLSELLASGEIAQNIDLIKHRVEALKAELQLLPTEQWEMQYKAIAAAEEALKNYTAAQEKAAKLAAGADVTSIEADINALKEFDIDENSIKQIDVRIEAIRKNIERIKDLFGYDFGLNEQLNNTAKDIKETAKEYERLSDTVEKSLEDQKKAIDDFNNNINKKAAEEKADLHRDINNRVVRNPFDILGRARANTHNRIDQETIAKLNIEQQQVIKLSIDATDAKNELADLYAKIKEIADSDLPIDIKTDKLRLAQAEYDKTKEKVAETQQALKDGEQAFEQNTKHWLESSETQHQVTDAQFANYEQVVGEIIQIGEQALQQSFALEQQQIDASLNARIKSLDAEYNEKLKYVEKGSEAEASLLEELENKKIELEKKAANERKEIAKKQAIIQGALATITALASQNYVQAALAPIITAIQVAAIDQQQFAEGGQVLTDAAHQAQQRGRIVPMYPRPLQFAPIRHISGRAVATSDRNMTSTMKGDNVVALLGVDEVVLNKRQQRELLKKTGNPNLFEDIGINMHRKEHLRGIPDMAYTFKNIIPKGTFEQHQRTFEQHQRNIIINMLPHPINTASTNTNFEMQRADIAAIKDAVKAGAENGIVDGINKTNTYTNAVARLQQRRKLG